MNDIVDGFKIRKTAKNARDNASVWYFKKTDDDKYLIYTLIGEEKVYMKMTTNGNQGNMSMVPEADATAFDVTPYTNNNIKGFYISSMNRGLNMFGGGNGNGFAEWHQKNGGSHMILTYPPVIVNDPANLDGKSYALIMTKLARPTALMADDCPNHPDRRMAVEAMLRNNPFISGTNLIQMTNSDLTLWTFENISGSKYYITTQTDDGTKYLWISGTSVELADTPDDDCVLTVQQGTGEYSGMIHIANSAGKSINQYSKDIKNGFGGYSTEYKENEWLSLAQLSVITDDDFVTNTAQKISVSDIRDGQQIPAWNKVQVVDLPVGTKFRVDEFFSETPLGYNLKGYERDQGSYYIADPNDPENIGIVRETSNPAMKVKNERGLGISAEKIWADKYVASEHEPVYFALYEKNGTSETMVSNTIRQLKYPNTTVKWYLSSSYGDLSNYVVRELKTLSQPYVDEDGNVNTYSGTAIPLGEGATDTLMVGARNTGSTQMKNKEYYVTYENGEIKSTANNDEGKPLKNTREDKVTNTPAEKGVKIRLSEWNGTEADRTFKAALADGAFTLKLNGDEIDFGEYISDENGTVAVLYDYKKGENNVYTLTQTAATITWVGADTPINFYIEETAEGDRIRIINPEDDGWVNHKDITSKELIGEITVYNKKLSLSMIKYASGSDTPLAKAEFSIYRGTKQSDGSYLQNYYPLADYESLVTGADGIIPKIDKTLPSSRYFLKEVRAPNGYERFVDPIEFNITKLGEVELINKPQGVSLVSDTSEEGKVIVRIKAGNNLKGVHVADLTVKKKVEGLFGDKTKRFEFKLEVINSAEESFTWLLNGEEQESIRSGDTFTLADGDTAVFTLPLECDVTIAETEENYTASMKLDETDKGDTNSVTFEFLAASELLVTNTRNDILTTGIPGSLCKSLLLFVVPTVPIGAILYSKRKKKRTA